jgi:hypothetical protein
MTRCGFDFGEYTRAYSVETMNELAAQNSHCMKIEGIGGAGISSRDDLNSRQSFGGTTSRSYRLHLVFILPHLTCLDGICITAEEKVRYYPNTQVSSTNRFHPPPHVVKSVHHAMHNQRNFKLFASIRYKFDHNAPQQQKRLIVICGPSGSGKRTLTKRLVADFAQLFGVAVSHTTRKPRGDEVPGKAYHFIPRLDMKRMISRGKMLQHADIMGNTYGITYEAVESVWEHGKLCVMDLELEVT